MIGSTPIAIRLGGSLAVVAVVLSACATAAPGPTGTSAIAIGLVVSLSGPDRANAEQAVQGATVAIADVNSHGRAGSWRLRLVQVDDQSDGATAKEVCRRLVAAEHVAAILGVQSALPRDTCTSVARAAGVPYFAVAGSAPTGCTPDVVYLSPQPEQRAGALVAFLIQQMNLARLYLIGDSSADGLRLLSAAVGQIQALKGTVLASERLPTNPDFDKLGRRIAAAHPDVIVEGLTGPVETAFYAAIAAAPWVAQTQLASLQLDEAGASAIAPGQGGIYIDRDYLAADSGAANQAWLTAMMARYGDGAVPTSLGAQANDAIQLMAASIEAAGPQPAAIMRAVIGRSINGPRGPVTIEAASQGYATLTMHIGKLDSGHVVRQLSVSPPIDPVVACTR